jgi:hypothetical protein
VRARGGRVGPSLRRCSLISWLGSRPEPKEACEELCRPSRGSRRLFCSSAGDQLLRGDCDVPSVPRVYEEDDLLASDPRSETTRAGSLLERGIPGGYRSRCVHARRGRRRGRSACLFRASPDVAAWHGQGHRGPTERAGQRSLALRRLLVTRDRRRGVRLEGPPPGKRPC